MSHRCLAALGTALAVVSLAPVLAAGRPSLAGFVRVADSPSFAGPHWRTSANPPEPSAEAEASGEGGQAPPGAAQTRAAAAPPRTPWGDPDLQGLWDQTTGTPLERPSEYAGREFLTDEEAVERERNRFAGFDDAPRQGSPGNYGSLWRDGSSNALTRTSLIVDPPDGRIPALTPEAQERAEAARAYRREHPADSWEDRSLWERCISRGVPRIPNNYNSNLLILQTPELVVILNEMINETRMIHLDGRPQLGQNIRLWNGDSRGHWEGNTLVVETTNFSDKQVFRGFPEGNLRLVERFTRIAPDQIDYRMTLHDPTTYTKPWTVVLPMTKSEGPIFEYACHEGNYGLMNILRGARAEEAAK